MVLKRFEKLCFDSFTEFCDITVFGWNFYSQIIIVKSFEKSIRARYFLVRALMSDTFLDRNFCEKKSFRQLFMYEECWIKTDTTDTNYH